MRRPGENIDLCARVIHIIFARHIVADLAQQRRKNIADHRPAGMPDMHRSGRIGGDIFDIDRLAATDIRIAVGNAPTQNAPHLFLPGRRLEPQVHEARSRDFNGSNTIGIGKPCRNHFREIAGFFTRRLRQDHGNISRDIAMQRIARRLHRNPVQRQIGRQVAGGGHIRNDLFDNHAVAVENVHLFSSYKS